MNLPVTGSLNPPRSVYAARLQEFPEIAFAEQAAFQHRGHWAGFFRDRIGPEFDGRVIFEVGCFDASFLTRIAAKHPRTGFVGLDWKCKAVYDGAKRVADLGLRNVALLRGRGQDIRRIFADGEVDEIWVFHPDPCAGKAELKNRLIAEPFLLDVHAVLRNGASTLSVKTDHPGYYQWVLAHFGLPEPKSFRKAREGAGGPVKGKVRARDLMRPEELPPPSETLLRRCKVLANSSDFWNDAAARKHVLGRRFSRETTLFEQRFLKKRLPIYFFEIGKKCDA
jgi:tRNA G46 methylase TrmB